MSEAQRPLEHVRNPVSDARVERQWAALEAHGLPQPSGVRRARWLLVAPALLGCALAGAFAWSLFSRPARLPVGALVESVRQPVAVRLEDGSRLELAPETRMQLLENDARAIELDLREGRARLEVTHAPARKFKVRLGMAEVRVIGTRFELERKPRAGGTWVRVSVIEGVVELRRRDQPDDGDNLRRLHAGESWSATFGTQEQPKSAAVPAPASSEERALEQKQAEDPAAHEVQDATSSDEAKEAGEVAAAARPGVSRDTAADAGASHVFKRASVARRAGRMREAADAYAALLARYPSDARAGLSAFELGRIRMDALGDPEGAIAALARAADAGAGTSFHEDALARIALAYDALGRNGACREARDRYLAEYPHGVHAHALAAQCK
jgi:transmembrane sensor